MSEIVPIAEVVTGHYRIPLPRVLSDSTHGEIRAFELVTVRLRDEQGLEGVGFTYTVGHGGSAIRELIDTELAPLLCGLDTRRHELVWQRMWWRLHYVGRGGIAGFALSAVDIALADLRGKRCGEPLWRLLGGASDRVAAYAGGVDLEFTEDELLAEIDEYLAEGFRAVKIKVGRENLEEDIERVRAVRRKLGFGFALMIDANMQWTLHTATRAVQALRDQSLFWIEEPIEPDDEDGHRQLAMLGVPIATGENLHTEAEFERMARRGGVSVLQPDVTNIGGVTGWMRVACAAGARNLPVSSHGAHDIHVHLLAAVPNSSLLEVHRFGLERFLKRPLHLRDGCAVPPEEPGLGLDFTWEALASHEVTGRAGE